MTLASQQDHLSEETQAKSGRPTLVSYVVGYILSVFLTLSAYLIVVQHMSMKWVLVGWVIGLALVQFVVQLVFFLHLGRETRPRWKLLVLAFMALIVLILVLGSLWIMYNLNYRMTVMTPQQINSYMQNQDGGI